MIFSNVVQVVLTLFVRSVVPITGWAFEEMSSSPVRENATMYTLCRNSDLYDMLETIHSYETRFNHRFHYDWVFLNDKPFDTEFMDLVTDAVSGEVHFGLIPEEHWSFPQDLSVHKMNENIEKLLSDEDGVLPYAGSISYRHMCRFETGFFYQHPLLQRYQYFWRVEPGVRLFCDVLDDPFMTMESNGYMYGFTISTVEYPKSIPTLFDHVKQYLEKNELSGLLYNKSNYSPFIYDPDTDSYNSCHFWTNFEIGNLDVFRSEEYNRMFEYLDRQNGFFYERWGDAPIRSIILSLILQKGQIHRFHDLGYLHEPYLQCPTDTAVRRSRKCSCDPDQDFTNHWFSCSWLFDLIQQA